MASPPETTLRADVVVVGAGASGLYAALGAARSGASVVLLSRSPLAGAASYWAQGGIAAALGRGDSPERHLADTLEAGRGISRPSAAEALCRESPARVAHLAELGVRFDRDEAGALALGLEGGHSSRRVVHAGGTATGRQITRALAALAASDERVRALEGMAASSLRIGEGRCTGVVAGRVEIAARAVVLATGGAGALWSRTTNPPGAVGHGLELALAAGARLADLELVQFHPTALVSSDGADGFLVSEALRGEGAVLRDQGGERFVDELAPRDRVARAIAARMRESGGQVCLDMRGMDLGRFPNVARELRRAGFDPVRQPVPVAPAAHYTMGGIATDADGRASVPGLFAIGECACTGLHGANRLASNSLAECLVLGARAAQAALLEPAISRSRSMAAGSTREPRHAPSTGTRKRLWALAGLERSGEGLRELSRDRHPLARLVALSALTREESRGAHRRVDRPELDRSLDAHHVVIDQAEAPWLERWE